MPGSSNPFRGGNVCHRLELPRLLEQRGDASVEIERDELCIGHGLERDVDRGRPRVLRDQRLSVDRVRERALAQFLETGRVARHLPEQARNVDQVALLRLRGLPEAAGRKERRDRDRPSGA